MHSAFFALQILAWLIAVAWLGKFVEAAWGLRSVANLSKPEYDWAPSGEPSLAVIVPARNEAAGIAACLTSLLAQDYAGLRIVAVDDRSTDATGAIMDALGLAHPDRIEVLHVSELPAGWLGKTHAMAMAARHVFARYDPDYLLFTDGDVVFHPEILRRSLAYAVATEADHFVTLPTTLAKSAGEAMMLSYLQVMGLWAVRTWRVARPGRRDAIGVGAFNLMRAAAYRQLGGFDAMPMEILEDLTMGRRVKRAGLRQRVAAAPGMVNVHWAAGLFGIVNNMTKNIFAVFRFRVWLLLAAVTGLAVSCVGPAMLLAVVGARVPALIAVGSMVGIYFLSSRTSRISGWFGLLAPVGAALVVYSMLRSMVITLRDGGVTWRGTFYPLAGLRRSSGGDAGK